MERLPRSKRGWSARWIGRISSSAAHRRVLGRGRVSYQSTARCPLLAPHGCPCCPSLKPRSLRTGLNSVDRKACAISRKATSRTPRICSLRGATLTAVGPGQRSTRTRSDPAGSVAVDEPLREGSVGTCRSVPQNNQHRRALYPRNGRSRASALTTLFELLVLFLGE
jgi:hypothetical protein